MPPGTGRGTTGRTKAHLRRIRVTPYDLVRIILGLIVLTAAALKGHQLATEPVAETGLLTSRWFLICIVEFELFFGLWLCSGLYPRRTWQAALLCFSALACVSLYKALSGEATCGCFGRVPLSPWYTLILDLGAVAGLFFCPPQRRAEVSPLPLGEGPGVRARVGWVVAIFLLVGIPAAFPMATYHPATLADSGDIFGDSQFVVLEPQSWIGKRFPLLKYIDIGDKLADGQWILVLYRHDCAHCRELIGQYERLSRLRALGPLAPRVALVEMAPYQERHEAVLSHSLAPVLGHLDDTREWFGATPITVLLNEGVVTEGVDWDPQTVVGRASSREHSVARHS